MGISGHLIDPANTVTTACQPYGEIPAWWSGFLFHVLNTRQVSMYLYLTMLSALNGACHPTTKQIREDLGLSSLTIVFDSISVLEYHGFILRQRRHFAGLNSRRNVYQRPSCDYTILRLLELDKLDGTLHASPGIHPMSEESQAVKDEWLAHILGSALPRYKAAPDREKRSLLIDALRSAQTQK